MAGLGFPILSSALTAAKQNFSHVEIKNFGQMDERFYRGAQPKEDQFKSLAELGINTLINLRDGASDYEEEARHAYRINGSG